MVAPDHLGTFLLSRFRRAAVSILAAHATKADLPYVRRIAEHADFQTYSGFLHLFDRFGTAHDVPRLLSLIPKTHEDRDRRWAADTAFRLSFKTDRLPFLSKVREEHPQLRVWATEKLRELPGAGPEAWGLLWHDDADVRLAAADIVWDSVDVQTGERLLSYYIQRHHFYNVVRLADRKLYTPRCLRCTA